MPGRATIEPLGSSPAPVFGLLGSARGRPATLLRDLYCMSDFFKTSAVILIN